ncbi:MAG: DNA primase, partial [Ignavibacteria bacterium]|nr:DNA primase [Ignavibacteria bacterium]
MSVSEQQVEQIRESVNIVDIISQYVDLKKRGKNYVGRCPFHNEKTPSFTVNEEKRIYHCFGCHAGGNVFKFLMEIKNISFVEALKETASFAGINIEEESSFNKKLNTNEIYYEINELAAKYFSSNLLTSKEGETARQYFNSRKVKIATQRSFGLGYAFPGWDNLLNFLGKEKADILKAKELGLIDSKDGGGYYDKYRGRIIFPIFSANGRVIGFGGRILEKNDNVAKYLNSPESAVYSKRKVLYGLFHSKDEIRKLDKAILVEGYMDIISLFQAGIKNVVASSGTALTEEQVQLLSRFTKNVVVNFDADEAGQKAALRSIEILLKYDFDVRILDLPDGEDPDSFVNKYGKDQFEEKVNNSGNFLEYQMMRYEKAGMLAEPASQTEAIRNLVKNAALVSDELKRSIMIKTIAKKFNLREKLIESELEKVLNVTQNIPTEKQFIKKEIGISDKKVPAPNEKANPVERDMIKLLFEGNAEITGWVFDTIIPEEFSTEITRKIADI